MQTTNHSVEEDILELKQRFDTAPHTLTKQDYQHLVHTVDHISTDGSNANKIQWRGDIQRAVSKKTQLKYTDDGFAIADKSLSQNTTFHVNTRIAMTHPLCGATNTYIIRAPKGSCDLQTILESHDDYLQIGDIFTIKWSPKDPTVYKFERLGHSQKIFTFYKSRKYINGKRQNPIYIEKLDWEGKFFYDWDKFSSFLHQQGILHMNSNGLLMFAHGRIATKHTTHSIVNQHSLGIKRTRVHRFKWVKIWTWAGTLHTNKSNPTVQYVVGGPLLGDRYDYYAIRYWGNITNYLLHIALTDVLGNVNKSDQCTTVLHCYIDKQDTQHGFDRRYYFDAIVNTKSKKILRVHCI